MTARLTRRSVLAAATVLALIVAGLIRLHPAAAAAPLRQMEYLNRGLVAVKVSGGVYLSWRFLGDEPDSTAFRVYRGGTLLTTVTTSSNYTDAAGTTSSSYQVATYIGGVEGAKSGAVKPMTNQYRDIKLQRPPSVVSPMVTTWATTTTGKQYEPVNMDLLRKIRDADAKAAGLTQAEFATLIAPFKTYFNNANWAPTNPFGTADTQVSSGHYKISDALFAELQAAFKRYVDELDHGSTMPYAKKADGSIDTATATYSAGDASAGDLDGDGTYELVVKWDPSNEKDPSQVGITAPTIVDAYKLDGTLLWRINMGYNIHSGAHDTQLEVYDFNGDGRAEVLLKTADGTETGTVSNGKYVVNDVIGDKNATPEKIQSYIAAGDATSLDRYHDALHGYSVGWQAPGGNTPAAQNTRQWVKIYTYGPIGPSNEYLTAFDGLTGRVLDTVPYAFPYGAPAWGASPENEKGAWFKTEVDPYWWADPKTQWGYYPWGDPEGNRANRFLAGVAYLDGVHPSAIMARGYYARTTLAPYTFTSANKLVLGKTFDSATLPDPLQGMERGAHSLEVADVDGDGKDEIVYGAMVVDDDMTIKTVAHTWFPYPAPATQTDLTPKIKAPSSTARWVQLAHGDALHVGDFNPNRAGEEVFFIQETWTSVDGKDHSGNKVDAIRPGGGIYDPVTGEMQTAFYSGKDNGRGAADNIDPNSAGAEYWSDGEVYSAVTGQRLYASTLPVNFLVYWDGDLTREILDSNKISKANTNYTTRPTTMGKTDLLTATGATAINGTKSTPVLSADLFGDWREEVIWKVGDDTLRLYTTTIPTKYKIRTLMHDPQYRVQVASENTTYNQPPHPSFYLDPAYPLPKQRTDIDVSKRS